MATQMRSDLQQFEHLQHTNNGGLTTDKGT
jgi:hypothetical protein